MKTLSMLSLYKVIHAHLLQDSETNLFISFFIAGDGTKASYSRDLFIPFNFFHQPIRKATKLLIFLPQYLSLVTSRLAWNLLCSPDGPQTLDPPGVGV